MPNEAETLVHLSDSDARNAWLQTHYPTVHEPLVTNLRSAAQLSEQQDPNRTLQFGNVLSQVAHFWADNRTLAEAHLVQANARQLLGEHESALQLYKQAAALYDHLQQPDEVANAAIGEILVHLALGDFAAALALADTNTKYFQKNNDELRLGRTLLNRGNVRARMGDFELALNDYEQAKVYFAKLEMSHLVGMIEANQGNIYDDLSQFRQAEAHYAAAKSYFDKAKMKHASAQVQHNLAYLAFSKGEYAEALHLFADARNNFVTHQHMIDVAYVDLYRSEVYLALNLWDKAIEDARSAREYFRGVQIPWEEARAYLNEAVALAHSGERDSANARFDAARTLFKQLDIPLWIAMVNFYYGTILLRDANYAKVKSFCAEAYEIFSGVGMLNRAAQCQLNLGTISLAEDDITVAEDFFMQAVSTLGNADLPSILYQHHYGMAQVHEKRGAIELAQQSYLDAFTNIERIGQMIGAEDYKISFHKDKQQIYDRHILFCLQQGGLAQQKQAFATLERAKARLLLATLERGLHNRTALPVDSELMQKIQSLQEELAWHYNRIFVSVDEDDSGKNVISDIEIINERERELNRLIEQAQELNADPTTKQLDDHAELTSPLDVQKILPVGTIFLEYFVSDYTTTVFIISREEFQTVTLSIEQSLLLDQIHEVKAQMEYFRRRQLFAEQYSNNLLQSIQETLYALYNLLLEPVFEHINATILPESLLIVPHGILHFVPFHALYDGKHYLIESCNVSYAPSAAILYHLLNKVQSDPPSSPIVFGLSDKSIPQAEIEACRIATLVSDSELYVGESATSDTLLELKSHVPFLHLASHALFRADNPKYSAIKLNDRWLTLHELEALQLQSDLVTLSACETGISHIHAGDELTGFYNIFFRNAAQALLLSLWQIDDTTTTELMTCFYTELKNGASCQAALRMAQMKVLLEHPHPYHWAGFALSGNSGYRLT